MSTDSLSAAIRLFPRWERMGKTIGESTLRWLKKAGTLVTQSSYCSLIYPINAPPMPPGPGKLKSVPVLIGKIIGRRKLLPWIKLKVCWGNQQMVNRVRMTWVPITKPQVLHHRLLVSRFCCILGVGIQSRWCMWPATVQLKDAGKGIFIHRGYKDV